jgi:hypothetical protein
MKVVSWSCGEKVGDEKTNGGEWQSGRFKEEVKLAFSHSAALPGRCTFSPHKWLSLKVMDAWT